MTIRADNRAKGRAINRLRWEWDLQTNKVPSKHSPTGAQELILQYLLFSSS